MMYFMVDCESVRPAIREGKAVMDAARNNFPNNDNIKRYLEDVYANIEEAEEAEEAEETEEARRKAEEAAKATGMWL